MNTKPIKKFIFFVFKGLFLCFLLFAAIAAYAIFIEPSWLTVNTISLSQSPTVRIVHFTDTHYAGNSNYLNRVIRRINDLKPDFVCFTGDIVEETEYLDEALTILSGIQAPVYGCPGNHDYLSNSGFDRVSKAFHAAGGAWLKNSSAVFTNAGITITGYSSEQELDDAVKNTAAITNQEINICLMHYPARIYQLPTNTFDLILSGHSHGGQVRLPFIGALILPFGVDAYDRGQFSTSAGPLYVNPGIGTFLLPVRLFCRPEITVIEL